MSILLATRFKARRLELKISQAELANEICEQAQISRIEQGNYSPGAELLYKLANRLNVTVNYFFDEKEEEKTDNLSRFREMSKKYLSIRDFEGLKYIYDLESERNLTLSQADKLYLTWIKAVLLCRYEGQVEEGIALMESILEQINKRDTMYTSVATSLAGYYFETGRYDLYEKLTAELLENIKGIHISNVEELETVIKFKYNYCRELRLKNDEKATSATVEAINFCKKYRTTYTLADLHCILADILEDASLKDEVRENLTIANMLYKLEGNNEMTLKTEQYINNLK